MQFAGVDSTPAAVIDISGQGMQLIDLQEATPDSGSELGFGQIAQKKLGLEDPAQVPISPVETVLGTAGDQSLQGY